MIIAKFTMQGPQLRNIQNFRKNALITNQISAGYL